MDKPLYSTAEVAEILGISRVTVFKKIKAGILPAKKVGRNYVITLQDLLPLVGGELSSEQKSEIEQAVRQALEEYGEVFKKLGRE